MDMLSRYAKVTVKIGLNVQPGQQVIIQAPVIAMPLVRLVTDEAYKAGASLVIPILNDEYMQLSRFKNTQDEKYYDVGANWLEDGIAKAFGDNAARLVILGNNPSYLKDIDPNIVARVSRSASKAKSNLYGLITGGASNWSIVAYATPEWAKQVFPELPVDQAVDKLWNAIYDTTRIKESDPVEAWKEHNASLAKRCAYLNEQNFMFLHFKNDIGTDVKIGLANGHIWKGGCKTTKNGITNNSNMPTEEVFTTPHRSQVNGVVKSTKPLYYNGTKIDGITATFNDGVATVTATEGETVLRNLLQEDANACRIGEIALVPYSSPISKSGIIFQETLFDENASCHMAFGTSYSQCISHFENETPEDLVERGANKSRIHTDWMIGDNTTDIDGISHDGDIIPLMRKGEWCQKL